MVNDMKHIYKVIADSFTLFGVIVFVTALQRTFGIMSVHGELAPYAIYTALFTAFTVRALIFFMKSF